MSGAPSLLTDIPTFDGVSFFLGDEMHLIGRGISALVYNLLNPKSCAKFKSLDSTKKYTFELKFETKTQQEIMEMIGSLTKESRRYIPPAFEGNWEGIGGFSRAVDYVDFLLYVVPTIVLPLVKSRPAQMALMNLVNGCSIALQWSISPADVIKMDR